MTTARPSGDHSGVDYPELAARTRRFSCGTPRSVTVSGDGGRVVFLRSSGPEDPADRLWIFDLDTREERLIADPAALRAPADVPAEERALRERLRLSTEGIGSYALDAAGTTAVFALAGRLFRADLRTGAIREVPTFGPVVEPRPEPSGRRIAYVTGGALRVVSEAGEDSVLAAEDGVTWGLAEFIAAEEFHRFRGYWWAPGGGSVLAARVDESRVPRWHLHDPAAPEAEPRSVAYPFAGSTNAEVTLHLLDLDGGWVDVLVEAQDGEPSEQHLYRVRGSAGVTGADARRVTTEAGWHTGYAARDTLVVGALSLDHAGWRYTVYRGPERVGELANLAATPPYAPRPVLERVTDRRLPTGVLYPRSHVTGRRLPVLVDVYGGPGHQEVVTARSRWVERQ